MRKIKKRTWEAQFQDMIKHCEKENEKQIKDFLKKNGDVMKVVYKTDKISDIIKLFSKQSKKSGNKDEKYEGRKQKKS